MENSNGSPSSEDKPSKYTKYHLQKMGVELEDCDYIVALAGNPNTGKSTVFNNLTGLHQHTGNWPGKTVTRAVGAFEFADTKFKVVDLPGTYSLLAVTEDEEIARDFILFGRPDVTVIVVDATCLERNLNLVLQILEITDRVVVDLNLMDEAKRHNFEINDAQLSNSLGVPVVPTVARYNKGMDDLIKAIHEVATHQRVPHAYHIKVDSPELKKAVDVLSEKIEKIYPHLPNTQWLSLRLLDGDQKIIEAFRNGDFADMA
jgi:Fe2+ transport system protein B